MRKNSLFVGSVELGERVAVLLTVLLNCKLCGAKTYGYMATVSDKIAAGHRASRVENTCTGAGPSSVRPKSSPAATLPLDSVPNDCSAMGPLSRHRRGGAIWVRSDA